MELWLLVTQVLEYSTLAVLLVLSIWSIAIMIDRRFVLRREFMPTYLNQIKIHIRNRDLPKLKEEIKNSSGIHSGTIRAALEISAPDSALVERSVRSFLGDERARLERGLAVLATLGANAPFIGLFGTVLGIIRAFAALGENVGAATSVMSGISQALYATAAGLFVAIPAVIAFNFFSNRLRVLLNECDSLKDYFLSHCLSPQPNSQSNPMVPEMHAHPNEAR